MRITECRIQLVTEGKGQNDRIRGFACIVLDDMLAVRDLKIVDTGAGLVVAMPSRKLCDRCHDCGAKNIVVARWCNACGARLAEHRATFDAEGRPKLHADVAHPIRSEGRRMLERAVLDAYEREVELAARPGYVCRYHEVGRAEDAAYVAAARAAMRSDGHRGAIPFERVRRAVG